MLLAAQLVPPPPFLFPLPSAHPARPARGPHAPSLLSLSSARACSSTPAHRSVARSARPAPHRTCSAFNAHARKPPPFSLIAPWVPPISTPSFPFLPRVLTILSSPPMMALPPTASRRVTAPVWQAPKSPERPSSLPSTVAPPAYKAPNRAPPSPFSWMRSSTRHRRRNSPLSRTSNAVTNATRSSAMLPRDSTYPQFAVLVTGCSDFP